MPSAKKIIVVYRVNQHSKQLAGVFLKLMGQLEGFREKGFEVFALYMSLSSQTLSRFDGSKLVTIKEWTHIPVSEEKKHFWSNASEAVGLVGADVIYSRYDKMYERGHLSEFYANTALSHCVKCLEIATYPYEREIADPKNRKTDRENLAELLVFVDLLYSTSNLNMILGKKSKQITNQLSKQAFIECSESNAPLGAESVNILCVANVSAWHGYDRILAGLYRYYANAHNRVNVTVTIAGEGAHRSILEQKSEDLNLQKYVHFVGQKSSQELIELYGLSSIGAGALAVHRKGLTDSCALKVREYLANGLPVLYASNDPLLENCEWALEVSNDDTPIDIDKLVDFVAACDAKESSRCKIRAFAKQTISWEKFANLIYSDVEALNSE